MRNELGLSVDHFKRAAALAAQETSATVGPKFTAAKDRVQPAASKAKGVATSGWDTALAAITPLVAAATDNAKQSGRAGRKAVKKQAKVETKNAKRLQKRAEKELSKTKRRSKLTRLALLGAAVGVGAAYLAKRRNQGQWEEYDPAPLTSTQAAGAEDAAFEPIEPTAYTSSSNGTVTDITGTQSTR